MAAKQNTELTKRAFNLGFRQGYEIANRTPIEESSGRDEFVNLILEAAINSLETTVFKSISTELNLMNEEYPAFDCWTVFADGVIQGAGENYSDRTGNEYPP
jgi:hypothetical protein